MRTAPHILASVASLALLPHALAQDNLAAPLEAATQPRSDQPLTAARLPAEPDDDAELLAKYLSGTFTSPQDGDRPALVLHSAPVKIDGLPNSIVVEIARADSPADPFRVYFLRPYRRQGTLHLRLLELPATAGLKDALAGLGAAPDAFPRIDPGSLSPSLDMPVKANKPPGTAASFSAETEHPFPTTRAGASELTASISADPSGLRCSDAGFDSDGKQVWGQAKTSPIAFSRTDSRPLVTHDESGVVWITAIPAPANSPKIEPDGELVFHYTSWLTSGLVIESSRLPGHEPAKVRIPGNFLPGLAKGLAGIAKGERRKIIVPPELAYGNEGRASIPPKATLIFDVECLKVDNNPGPPAASPAMFNPHAPVPGATPPVPADPSAPIGSPPTNGGPEAPRGGGH